MKLQVRQQKKRTRTTEEKRPCAPLTLRFGRVVEVEVLGWRMECHQKDSSAVWGQLQGMSPARKDEFLKWHAEHRLERARSEGFFTVKQEGGGTWRTKKAFPPTRSRSCAWVYGRSRTKNPKGRMFKVLFMLLVKGKIHCHYH